MSDCELSHAKAEATVAKQGAFGRPTGNGSTNLIKTLQIVVGCCVEHACAGQSSMHVQDTVNEHEFILLAWTRGVL